MVNKKIDELNSPTLKKRYPIKLNIKFFYHKVLKRPSNLWPLGRFYEFFNKLIEDSIWVVIQLLRSQKFEVM